MGVEVGAKTLWLVPVLALGQECWRLQACADLGPSPVVLSMCVCVCVCVCMRGMQGVAGCRGESEPEV